MVTTRFRLGGGPPKKNQGRKPQETADGLMCSLSLTDVGHGIRGCLSTCQSVTARGGVLRGLAKHAPGSGRR